MKVLLVSHTVLSKTSNMGKTLLRYFQAFQPDEIAQFYIHSEVPTDDSICTNYYRFTDKDALKSIVPLRKHGTIFGKDDIQLDREFSRTDTGVTGKIYQFGRKRTGSIYLARNLVWKCTHWFTKELKQWLTDFNPDVIFFASGDYAFMYDVARKMAEYLNKPLVISCMDDFYVYNANENSVIGRFEYRARMKTVRKTMQRASSIFAICDTMAETYAKMFQLPVQVLHTPAECVKMVPNENPSQISYIGNLGCDRDQQLMAIGKALMSLNRTEEPKMLDVYSGEKNPEILKNLTEENGIRFHGQISAEEVLDVMKNSIAVIHTESFEESQKKQVRFSVSTKIAESLMYGPCLLAYGPEDIASISYLKENDVAYVIDDPKDLPKGLTELLEDDERRTAIVKRARILAEKNHNLNTTPIKVRAWLEDIVRE